MRTVNGVICWVLVFLSVVFVGVAEGLKVVASVLYRFGDYLYLL